MISMKQVFVPIFRLAMKTVFSRMKNQLSCLGLDIFYCLKIVAK